MLSVNSTEIFLTTHLRDMALRRISASNPTHRQCKPLAGALGLEPRSAVLETDMLAATPYPHKSGNWYCHLTRQRVELWHLGTRTPPHNSIRPPDMNTYGASPWSWTTLSRLTVLRSADGLARQIRWEFFCSWITHNLHALFAFWFKVGWVESRTVREPTES